MKMPFEAHARTCSRQGKVKESIYGLAHPGYDRRMIEMRCEECHYAFYRIGGNNWDSEITYGIVTQSGERTSK